MSGFLPRMRPASFRGCRFYVEDAGGDYGFRWVDHQYPDRHTPYAEPLGRAQRVWPITGYTLGPLHRIARNALLQACERGGVGELIHPAIGLVMAVNRRATWSEQREGIGRSIISLEFAEPGALEEPTGTPNSEMLIEAAADELGVAAGAAMQSSFNVGNTLSYVAENAGLDTQAMAVTLERHRVPADGYEQAPAVEAIDTLYQQGPALVYDPPQLRSRTETAFGTTSNTSDPATVVIAMLNIANNYRAGALAHDIAAAYATDPPGTEYPANERERRNQAAWQAYCRHQALREVGYAIPGAAITSQRQAERLRADITAAFDDAETVAANAGQDDLFIALIRLRAMIEANISSRNLPRMVVYNTLLSQNALVMAWSFYHDANRDLELVDAVHAINPAFMPVAGIVKAN
jgi:prophage DNA circulation protein